MKIPEKVSPWLCILKHRNFLKPKLISVQNYQNLIFELYFNLCENGSQNCFKVAINWTVSSLVIQKEFYLLKVIGQRSTDIYFVSTPFLLVAAAAAAAAVETKFASMRLKIGERVAQGQPVIAIVGFRVCQNSYGFGAV